MPPTPILCCITAAALLGGCAAPPAQAQPPSGQGPVTTVHGAEARAALRVTITADGDYYVQKLRAEGAAPGPAVKAEDQTPAALEQAIRQVAGTQNTMPVEIAADEDARFGAYVRLLDVLQKLEFSEFRVKTRERDQAVP